MLRIIHYLVVQAFDQPMFQRIFLTLKVDLGLTYLPNLTHKTEQILKISGSENVLTIFPHLYFSRVLLRTFVSIRKLNLPLLQPALKPEQILNVSTCLNV